MMVAACSWDVCRLQPGPARGPGDHGDGGILEAFVVMIRRDDQCWADFAGLPGPLRHAQENDAAVFHGPSFLWFSS